MGDFVKGFLPAGLPPALASGVALHRAIDSFADRHPAFIASRSRISATRRRVAGVQLGHGGPGQVQQANPVSRHRGGHLGHQFVAFIAL